MTHIKGEIYYGFSFFEISNMFFNTWSCINMLVQTSTITEQNFILVVRKWHCLLWQIIGCRGPLFRIAPYKITFRYSDFVKLKMHVSSDFCTFLSQTVWTYLIKIWSKSITVKTLLSYSHMFHPVTILTTLQPQ